MKRIYTLIAALLMLSPTAIMADDTTTQTLTINGQPVEKAVASFTFDGDNVIIHFSDATQQTADMNDVTLALATTVDAIGEVKMPIGGRFDVEGLAAGILITVYDASGRTVLTTTSDESPTQLPVQQLKSGVYVMKAGNQIVKFIKR